MSKHHFVFGILAITLMIAAQTAGSEEEQFDNAVFSQVDQINPANEVIRLKAVRPSDWCQSGFRTYPYPYWPRDRSSDFFAAAKKRGYMGIEIPDFITSQDGTQQGGSAGGPKPRYFKNG
ncbi:unnamed protein product [Allacma fusca]|uniref:Uncharacterized protein n=1 Tax=Allacma fusca TaxID=39272 RepID=A0A8J2JVY3_9HEXA|nr:unnamed protein product [Allacma fusca]